MESAASVRRVILGNEEEGSGCRGEESEIGDFHRELIVVGSF